MKITLIYDGSGKAVSDFEVDSLISDLLASKKDVSLAFSTENIFHYVRAGIVAGKIDVNDIEFRTKNKTIELTPDGYFSNKDFCCLRNMLDKILKKGRREVWKKYFDENVFPLITPGAKIFLKPVIAPKINIEEGEEAFVVKELKEKDGQHMILTEDNKLFGPVESAFRFLYDADGEPIVANFDVDAIHKHYGFGGKKQNVAVEGPVIKGLISEL